jgi:glycosyltransferase involved in cell wall biosynthesis
MAKILYCGDAFVDTGFGRVAENLLPALSRVHDVSVLAVNYHGDPHPEARKYNTYPAILHGNDPFGTHRIAEVAMREKPDLIWVTNDIWIGITLWDAVKHLKEELGFKFFVYTPIDSYGLFPELLEPINEWDGIATYTQFGAEEIMKIGYEKPVHIVGHGTDFSKFFPLDKQECRRILGVPEDVFIIFNGNRNQPRKRIDLTIKGFIKFAKDKPDARLWLNMGQKDLGWDIIPLFKRVARDEGYDPEGKLILTSPHFSTINCLPVEQLNQVYNACEIGINTCIGEGWGLVNTEHAAAGIAQVVPDHTSCKEIFDGVPRIAIESWEVDRNYGLDRAQPSPDSLAEILTWYYENPDKLAENGKWCFDRVHEKPFTWPYIGREMKKIIENVLNKPSAPKPFKGFGTPTRID